jgi:hypothetical protein
MNAIGNRSVASLLAAALGLLLLTAPLGAAAPPHKRPSTTCTPGSNSFVGGGESNTACDTDAAVLAGAANTVQSGGDSSIIAGGQDNVISDEYAGIVAGTSNHVSNAWGVIGGGEGNSITGEGGFIGGGFGNSVTGLASAIVAGGNGSGNQISGGNSFIGAGVSNVISSGYAIIGGGAGNSVTSEYGTIAGGNVNQVTGKGATVAGGVGNISSGNAATVAGGYHNLASGQYSFAAGFGSYANQNGSFVWSDFSQGSKHLEPSAANQFIARAAGGVIFLSNAAQTTGVKLGPGSGAWASASDRNLKRDVATVNDAAILDKVAALPVAEWSYISEGGVRHLGPMAQDFYAAFGVGEDDRHITSIDEDGVALAAIKALNAKLTTTLQRLRAKDSEVGSLRARLANQGDELRAMRAELSDLEGRMPRR